MFKVIKISSLIILLFSLAQLSFANSVLSGGDTDRKYVVGLNFMGGSFGFQLEVEGDIGISESFSIAPRLGGTALSSPNTSGSSGNFSKDKVTFSAMDKSFFLGVSARFAIISGVRPHGFWIGPSMDIILGTYKSITITSTFPFSKIEDKFTATFTPSAEFGWRYTFDFGLSLQAMIRLGFYFDTNLTIGFYGLGGVGIGYSF